MKAPDKRCCGSGVCIISDAGECWCGQVWDGEKMAAPKLSLNKSKNFDSGSHEGLSPELLKNKPIN
jgi:hypothetical protein